MHRPNLETDRENTKYHLNVILWDLIRSLEIEASEQRFIRVNDEFQIWWDEVELKKHIDQFVEKKLGDGEEDE